MQADALEDKPDNCPISIMATPPDSSNQPQSPGAIACVLAMLRRLKRPDKTIAFSILMIAAALYGFVLIAESVIDGDVHAFDAHVLLALRDAADPSDPWGPKWFEEMVRDYSALGGTAVLGAFTLGTAGFLILTRRTRLAVLIVTSILCGLAMSHLLKWGFDRPRPDLVPHLSIVHTASFPSGHSMMSAIVYLSLAAMLARVQRLWRVRAYLLAAAALTTFTVGLSRIYLGVHWPSDVFAGWTIGVAWAAMSWLVILWMQDRGTLSQSGQELSPPGKPETDRPA